MSAANNPKLSSPDDPDRCPRFSSLYGQSRKHRWTPQVHRGKPLGKDRCHGCGAERESEEK